MWKDIKITSKNVLFFNKMTTSNKALLWNQYLIEVFDLKTRRVSKFSNTLFIKLCKYRILLLIFFGLDYRDA